MTVALCFNCGHTRFRAIAACPECQVSTTGSIQLDIAFSNHHISTSPIGAFGEVIRSISHACDDDGLRFRAFMRFVTPHHRKISPSISTPSGRTGVTRPRQVTAARRPARALAAGGDESP